MDEKRKERLIKKYERTVEEPAKKGPGHGPRGGRGPGGKPKNAKQTIKRLFSYLEKEKMKLFFVVLCVILNAIATLGGSYLLRPIINTYIAPENGIGNAKGLFLGLMVMAGVYLVGIVASYLQSRWPPNHDKYFTRVDQKSEK